MGLREQETRRAACCGDHMEGSDVTPNTCSEVGSLSMKHIQRGLLETSPAVLGTIIPLILPLHKTFRHDIYFLLFPSTGDLGFLLDAPYAVQP